MIKKDHVQSIINTIDEVIRKRDADIKLLADLKAHYIKSDNEYKNIELDIIKLLEISQKDAERKLEIMNKFIKERKG